MTRRSFEEFYAGTVDRLLGQLFLVTADLHEAEEVVQEAFVRAASRWGRLEAYDVPEAWVRRVAMNLAADRARWRRRRQVLLRRLGEPPQVPAASVDALALADALRSLPVSHRQAIVLHYLVDMPVEEIARTLGTSPGTVKSWLARGRRALAAVLGERQETWST
ncbi:MAG TPA: SigE family RNA polymerase sigma factor [Actinomycetes bacterium]|nr:SigE family RNA polymerase sigma factor [Actinomycetes bacterium]